MAKISNKIFHFRARFRYIIVHSNDAHHLSYSWIYHTVEGSAYPLDAERADKNRSEKIERRRVRTRVLSTNETQKAQVSGDPSYRCDEKLEEIEENTIESTLHNFERIRLPRWNSHRLYPTTRVWIRSALSQNVLDRKRSTASRLTIFNRSSDNHSSILPVLLFNALPSSMSTQRNIHRISRILFTRS